MCLVMAAVCFRVTSAETRSTNTNNTSNTTNHVIFVEIGTYVRTHATIHVAVNLNFTGLKTHCNQLRNTNTNLTSLVPRAKRILGVLNRVVNSTCQDVDQLTDQGHERQTRQIWAAAALVTGAFGIYEAVEVHRLHQQLKETNEKQQHLTTLLRHQDSRINHMAEHVNTLTEELAHTLANEALIASEQDQIYWLRDLVANAREFGTYVNRATQGMQDLHHGHLSTSIISREIAREILGKLQRQAEKLEGKLIVNNSDDLYQLPITVVYPDAGQVQLLIHVGVAKETLQLLRYVPSPLVVQQDGRSVALAISPSKTLLAHDENLHQEISESDLSTCQRNGNSYVCRGPAAYHTQLCRTCLGALFTGDVDAIKDLCPMHQTNTTWHAEALPNNQVAVYFRDSTNLQVTCKGQFRKNIILQGSHTIQLPANCSLTGHDLRITSREDILLRVPNITPPLWDPADFLQGKTTTEIQRIRARLDQMRLRPEKDVTDMLQQDEREQRRRQEQQQTEHHHYLLYMATGFNVVVLIYLVVRFVLLYHRA